MPSWPSIYIYNIHLYYPAAQVPATGVGCSRAELMPSLQAALFFGLGLYLTICFPRCFSSHTFQGLGGLPGPLLSAKGSITVWMHPDARVTCSYHLSLRGLRAEVISSRPSLASRVAEGTSSLIFTSHSQQIMALSFRRRICMSSALGA